MSLENENIQLPLIVKSTKEQPAQQQWRFASS
jgi:hypothetical protein